MVFLRPCRAGIPTRLAGAQDYPATYIRFNEGTVYPEIPVKWGGPFPKWVMIWSLMEGIKTGWEPCMKKFLRRVAGGTPVVGDWNGGGRAETGVYRSGIRFYFKMKNGSTWNPSTDVYPARNNTATDLSIAGNVV
jgi:hypothetical protein